MWVAVDDRQENGQFIFTGSNSVDRDKIHHNGTGRIARIKMQVTVDGHRPKEWFIVPFKVIEEAINAIILGKPIEYNPQLLQIIYN